MHSPYNRNESGKNNLNRHLRIPKKRRLENLTMTNFLMKTSPIKLLTKIKDDQKELVLQPAQKL